jgi:hypothetical protein
LADTDGNPATTPDPTWTPLITNPPYPDHPSGYNCISSAFLNTGQAFFGPWTTFPFTVHSNATNADRTYNRLLAPLRDTIDARVWEGIHFRTADEQAVALGAAVSRWLVAHYFRPVHS